MKNLVSIRRDIVIVFSLFVMVFSICLFILYGLRLKAHTSLEKEFENNIERIQNLQIISEIVGDYNSSVEEFLLTTNSNFLVESGVYQKQLDKLLAELEEANVTSSLSDFF